MTIYLNGEFVPAERAVVSVADRGFLYADSLFETLPCYHGQPFRWGAHWERLELGAAALRLRPPVSGTELLAATRELLRRNELTEAVVRWQLTRGSGPRGYSPRHAEHPTLVGSANPGHPFPANPQPPRHLHTATIRVAPDPRLSRFKTSDKLRQVLARAEADEAGADDALMLDPHGHLAETTAANLFWWTPSGLRTPSLGTGALAGVTRRCVIELAGRLGCSVEECAAPATELSDARGAFLTNSTLGLVEIGSLDERPLPRDPRFVALYAAYRQEIEATQEGD